jgi:hypothetical protein
MTTENEVIKHVQKHGVYFAQTHPHYVVSWKGVTYSSDDTRDLVVTICKIERVKGVTP